MTGKLLKVLPVVLLVGYALLQLIRKYSIAQELSELKAINKQLLEVKHNYAQGDAFENEQILSTRFILRHEGEEASLRPATITRIEADENYCHIYVKAHGHQEKNHYMVRTTLSEVASQLSTNHFIQTHRSHIVNMDYVSNITKLGRNYHLVLTNGDELPVSRQRLKYVRESIVKYLGSK